MSAIANIRQWLSWHYLEEAGDPLWTSIGEMEDELSAWLRLALRTRFPSVAPGDALAEIAYNQNLEPPVGAMGGDAAVRAYLANPWLKWEKAGTRQRLLEELALLGYSSCDIISWSDLVAAGNPPTVFGGFSSFFYVIIRKPNPWLPPGKWGDGADWGGGSKWGSTATWAEIQAIRRVIKKWKPAGSSCRFIEAWLQVSLFGFPVRWTRWPVNEDWERSATGAYPNFYNYSY